MTRRKKTDVFGLSYVLYWMALIVWLWITDFEPADPGWWHSIMGVLGLLVSGLVSWTVFRIRIIRYDRKGRKILSDALKNLEAAVKEEEARRRSER